ncbi:hypothetical protein [Pseudonocardia alaniniphila]|uniref:Uncharacterized protein n=1 Tax=Pseudonocardia alaniniphila TaxID=75291 RepID=A0ABS9TS95_9PSEU|nr:hypothetical protein [Pseudonocardia alaniniphila]MCH6171283.1 hypothetical protein [Pseudonocardia alaniniphila]
MIAALALSGCGPRLPPLPTGTGPASTAPALSAEAELAEEFRSAAAELDALERKLVACTDVDPTLCPHAVSNAGQLTDRLRADVDQLSGRMRVNAYAGPDTGTVSLLRGALDLSDEAQAEASPVCSDADADTCAGKVHSIIFSIRVIGNYVEILLK